MKNKIIFKVTGLPHIQKLSSDTREFEISSLLAERIYEIKLTPYYNDLEGQTGTLRISTGYIYNDYKAYYKILNILFFSNIKIQTQKLN